MSLTTYGPTIAPDNDVERDQDTSGSRIRGQLCAWSPRKDKRFCMCATSSTPAACARNW
jgi:hypothetical protein